MRKSRRALLAVGIVVASAMAATASVGSTIGVAGAARSVRGFDGSTVTVASLGVALQFQPGTANGVNARIKRFNDTNEIKGVQIKWTEFADDKQDPTTSLSEARRLVSQTGVFAIVGDMSVTNPGDYLAQQHVPYFGWGLGNVYCSPKQTTSLWGFGFNGCIVPADPSVVGDSGLVPYKYVSKQTGKQHPTAAIFSNDNEAGKSAVKFQAIAWKGAGFNVVAQNNDMPLPPVGDYTPYVQTLMTSNNGSPPDVMFCLEQIDCIQMFNLSVASGFKGTFISALYSDFLVKSLNGSASNVPFVPLDTTGSPGLEQLKKDMDAYQPGLSAKIDSSTVAGYASTDMFIQALKTVAKKGKSNITPENVQKAAATQTWQIKGLAGPTVYPKSTVAGYPNCQALTVSDGTTWKTVVPYTCSNKQFKVG